MEYWFGGEVWHIVARGETLEEIARLHNTRAVDIQGLNKAYFADLGFRGLPASNPEYGVLLCVARLPNDYSWIN